jgi:tetratricopeptide (TPR) repeat protein
MLLPVVSLAQTADQGEIPITCASHEAKVAFIEARDALDMGRTMDAKALLDKAIEKDPNFACAYLFKANAANSATEFRSNMDKAMANKRVASPGEQILIAINMTFLDNNAEKRFELAKKLAAEYPASQRALLTLAGQHQGRKEYTEARDLMYAAMQIDQDFPLPHRDLGFSYLFDEPKEFSLAEKHMKKFVGLRPNEASSHIALGDVYRAQSKLKEARDAYTKATKVDPQSYVGFSKKGHADTFLGNYGEARTDYQQSQELSKDNSKATWANFGTFTYLYAGDVKSALDANGKLVKKIDKIGIPHDQLTIAKVNTYFNRARMAMHHGMHDIAEEALKNYAVHLRQFAKNAKSTDFERSQNADIVLWEGMLAAHKGNFESANSKAERNRKLLEPDQNPRKLEGYHRLMGKVNLMLKNYQRAIDHYQQANVNGVQVKHELALAHEGAGNIEDAQKLFKEVAEWNFNGVGYALIRNAAIEKTKMIVKK